MQLNESLANTIDGRSGVFESCFQVMLDKAIGHTEDISVSGVYATFLDLTNRLTPGASVRLEMLFYHATRMVRARSPARVKGEVIRVDQRDGRVGVAARITSYRLAPPSHRN